MLRKLLEKSSPRTRKDYVFEGIQKALTLDSDDKQAYLALGQLMRDRGELQQAIRIHRGLQIGTDREIFLRSLLELARDYREAGLHDRARTAVEEFLDVRDSLEARALLLEVLIHLREYGRVVEVYRDLGKRTGEDFQREIALFYYLQYCEQQDVALLKKALKASRESFFVNLAYARHYRDQPRKGVEYLDQALASSYLVASLIYPFMEDVYGDHLGAPQIIERYRTRAKRFPTETASLQYMAHFLYRTGHKQEAFDRLLEVVESGEATPALARTLASLYYREALYEDAARLLLDHSALSPERFECRECGQRYAQHMLLCNECQGIGTLVEHYGPQDSSARPADGEALHEYTKDSNKEGDSQT